MLALSRKVGETIVVDERIVIRVAELGTNRIVLAIDAPREVAIRRGEIPARTKVSNRVQCPECERECEPAAGENLCRGCLTVFTVTRTGKPKLVSYGPIYDGNRLSEDFIDRERAAYIRQWEQEHPV